MNVTLVGFMDQVQAEFIFFMTSSKFDLHHQATKMWNHWYIGGN